MSRTDRENETAEAGDATRDVFGVVGEPHECDHAVQGRSRTTVCGRAIGERWLTARGIFDANAFMAMRDACPACSAEIFSRRAASSSESVPETPEWVAKPRYPVWLIERSSYEGGKHAEWLKASNPREEWTTEAHTALWFESEAEAHQMIMGVRVARPHSLPDAFVTEHLFWERPAAAAPVASVPANTPTHAPSIGDTHLWFCADCQHPREVTLQWSPAGWFEARCSECGKFITSLHPVASAARVPAEQTSEREREIQARLDAATPGPWAVTRDYSAFRSIADCGFRTYVESRNPDRFDKPVMENDANAALVANAPDDIAYLLAALRSQRERADRAESVAVIPGSWKCDKCGFVQVSSVLNPASGALGARTVVDLDALVCPNDGAALRGETWQERAVDLRAELSSLRSSAERDAARVGPEDVKFEVWHVHRPPTTMKPKRADGGWRSMERAAKECERWGEQWPDYEYFVVRAETVRTRVAAASLPSPDTTGESK